MCCCGQRRIDDDKLIAELTRESRKLRNALKEMCVAYEECADIAPHRVQRLREAKQLLEKIEAST